MKTRISRIILMLVLICLLAFNFSSAQNENQQNSSRIQELYETYGSVLVYLERYSFKELTPAQIKKIKEIQDEALFKIVSRIDKYSRYHKTEEWKKIQEEEQKESVIPNARMLNAEIGYIALGSFYDESDADFNKKVGNLKNLGMKKLIIDLRNNPGGGLMEADKILEVLVPAGRIEIYSMERDGQLTPFYSPPASRVPKIFSGKIAILINENSASASELVTISLKEQVAAIVIGKKSYGKGSIQALLPLPDGSALRLTTAHYLSPVLGEDIEGKGVIPDIEIMDDPNTPEDEVIKKAIEVLNN